jgi:hypothetical protein
MIHRPQGVHAVNPCTSALKLAIARLREVAHFSFDVRALRLFVKGEEDLLDDERQLSSALGQQGAFV